MKAVVVLAVLVASAVAAPQLRSRTVAPFISVVQRSDIRDYAGQYSHSYTGSDGTHASESGALQPNADRTDNVLVKQGFYRFTSPEGNTYQVEYTADENGFHPQGAHFPSAVADVAPTF